MFYEWKKINMLNVQVGVYLPMSMLRAFDSPSLNLKKLNLKTIVVLQKQRYKR